MGVHTFLDRIWTQPGNGGMTRLSACCNLLKETPPSLHLTPWPESKSSNEIRDMSELKEQDQQTVVKILLFPDENLRVLVKKGPVSVETSLKVSG